MRGEVTWAEAVATAKERKVIGATDVYLGDTSRDELDWSKCTRMEIGGSHRLDIYTSVVFYFQDHGLTFRWHFDIDQREANGHGYYLIDTVGIEAILARLPADSPAGGPRGQFLAYLKSIVTSLEKNAREHQEVATREFGQAAQISGLVRGR